jgi:ribosome-binding ATPase YchF (GTP1/OBG family)
MENGWPVSLFAEKSDDAFQTLNQELRFLSGKPVIYAANVDEDALAADNSYVKAARSLAAEQGSEVVKLCARFEEELSGMTDAERREFLELAGVDESGLEQIIRRSYDILGLISFFSMNEEETRAWTIHAGWTAPRAAGVIHTDFERGFIRAEVIPFDTFVQFGSSAAAKAAGVMRIEGKDYVVADGDIIYFRFNV